MNFFLFMVFSNLSNYTSYSLVKMLYEIHALVVLSPPMARRAAVQVFDTITPGDSYRIWLQCER